MASVFTNYCSYLQSSFLLKQHSLHVYSCKQYWRCSSVKLIGHSLLDVVFVSKWQPLRWFLWFSNKKCCTGWDMPCKMVEGSLLFSLQSKTCTQTVKCDSVHYHGATAICKGWENTKETFLQPFKDLSVVSLVKIYHWVTLLFEQTKWALPWICFSLLFWTLAIFWALLLSFTFCFWVIVKNACSLTEITHIKSWFIFQIHKHTTI